MRRYRSHRQALRELEEAAAWYEEQRSGLGEELLAEFERCMALALEVPGIGSPTRTASGVVVRKYRLDRFERYAIVLAFTGEEPTMVAFEHSSRRPGYWIRRLR